MATCLILMFGRIGAVCGSLLVGFLLKTDCDVLFYINGCVILSMFELICVLHSRPNRRTSLRPIVFSHSFLPSLDIFSMIRKYVSIRKSEDKTAGLRDVGRLGLLCFISLFCNLSISSNFFFYFKYRLCHSLFPAEHQTETSP